MSARLTCPHCGKAVALKTTTTQTLEAAAEAVCAQCGAGFTPDRPEQRYCSPKCRVEARRAECRF